MVSNKFHVEENKKTTKYPRSIFFIISNEFSERFNYYGMRTILVLYLTRKLGYDDDTTTVIFHIFTGLVYFFPLLGAVLADSVLGKFKTVAYLSIIYALGSAIIALGAIPPLKLPATELTMLGLFCIALGSGGIKPCVSAFGGDQFKIPEQSKQLATFFSLFYFSINAGSLISTFLTPILREDVHCFNDLDCFSLAFGVPAALMIVSIIIFILGKFMYVIKKPSGNMLVMVSKCICNAISTKSKEKETNPKEHWLDYAEAKYGKQLVTDIKYLFRILILYIPLPVFWALFDQQGSRWTFQATRMNGEVGPYTIKPDQMQVINPFLILAFIPLFDYIIYPILEKVGIKRPLQKLTMGGILAGIAFVISGFVQTALESTYPIIPAAGESQLRIFNGLPCNFEFKTDIPNFNKFTLEPSTYFEIETLPLMGNVTDFKFTANSSSQACIKDNVNFIQGNIALQSEVPISYFLHKNTTGAVWTRYRDNPDKDKDGFPLLRILSNARNVEKITFANKDQSFTFSVGSMTLEKLTRAAYDVMINGNIKIATVDLKFGGVYTLVVDEVEEGIYTMTLMTVTEPNSIHMLWLIPQYVVMTAAEVMFSITGLHFSFSQAPESMKSVIQACWLLTVSLGNVLVVAIAEAKFVKQQSLEFFLFAALMLIDMIFFIVLALRYKYVDFDEKIIDEKAIQMATSKTNADEDMANKTYTNDGFRED